MQSDDPIVYSPLQGTDSAEEPGLGWLYFAGTVLGLAGLMRVLDSVWAFRFHGSLPDGLQDAMLGSNLKTYAWLWLVVGLILIISSFLLLTGSQLARWVGYIGGVILGLTAMTWMPYYPIWSLLYVGLAVLVLYALARHGSRPTT